MSSLHEKPVIEGLSEELWLGLVALTRAVFDRDYGGLSEAVRQHPALSEPTNNRQSAEALRVMSYIVLARRIHHRPIVDHDALLATQELMRRISSYTLVDFADVLDAVRSALFLPVTTDTGNSEAANRIGGMWISIVGTRVDNFSEVLQMKSDVRKALTPRRNSSNEGE